MARARPPTRAPSPHAVAPCAPSRPFLIALLPVALFHTVGHVSACVSFSQARGGLEACVRFAHPPLLLLLLLPPPLLLTRRHVHAVLL